MDDAARARDLVAVVAVVELRRRVPQPGARAELDRADRDVERVHEVGVEELPDRLGPAAEAHVLPAAASRAGDSTSAGSPETKWNVVSPRVNEGRAWWVRTKTGVWNGGSSPHQPCHCSSSHGPRCGPNLLRPMISAPMPLLKSRTK